MYWIDIYIWILIDLTRMDIDLNCDEDKEDYLEQSEQGNHATVYCTRGGTIKNVNISSGPKNDSELSKMLI